MKARLPTPPRAVLGEFGLEVPDGIDVKVIENAEHCVYITLPARPRGDRTLSDAQMLEMAGGGGCACPECQHHHS